MVTGAAECSQEGIARVNDCKMKEKKIAVFTIKPGIGDETEGKTCLKFPMRNLPGAISTDPLIRRRWESLGLPS